MKRYQDSKPIVPSSWEGAREAVPFGGESPAAPAVTAAPPRKRPSGLPVFLVFLSLLMAVAVGTLLTGGWGLSLPVFQLFHQEDNWLRGLDEIEIPRAPLSTAAMPLERVRNMELTPQQVYRVVNPAVVEIQTYTPEGYYLGSGIIFTDDGYIVTNAHLLAGGTQVWVLLASGETYEAQLCGYDGATDLAVVKVDAQGLPKARLGDSSRMEVGDTVYAIGNPLSAELRGTMTNGILSAVDRTIDSENGSMTLLQHTAPINSGNSGGALVNVWGEVIGITNMKMMSDQETFEGLGFAIPTLVAKPVCDQLIALGEFRGKTLLGVVISTYDYGGALVEEVDPQMDAWAQGIRPGEVIVSADGETIHTAEDLIRLKNYHTREEPMELEVYNPSTTSFRRVTVTPEYPK